MRYRFWLICCCVVLLPVVYLVVQGSVPRASARPADPAPASLSEEFSKEVQPLLKRYCVRCHSEKKAEGDIDLGKFTSLEGIRKETRVWQKVLEVVDTNQMPPNDTRQPEDGERKRIVSWVRGFLRVEARAQAGDPGPVLLRRLNNVEYTNSVRDVTGVPLNPAR
ncbi:MAG: c-type cytochrome domain-containing protein, partial [Gemmataceae bacterium]